MGIEFEYEAEGFEFGDGTRYLPDFWLPKVNMWAEVKPALPTKGDAEFEKCRLLAEFTGKQCLILDGTPKPRPYPAVTVFEGTTDCYQYLLDIATYRTHYFREGRLFGDSDDALLALHIFSPEYLNACQFANSLFRGIRAKN